MSKPTMFFSHSTHDKPALVRLKDLFVQKTGGAIEVFLSSDGQSIPLGKNWVFSVEEGLNRATLMVVFLTPSSLKSHWLYFESGYAYCKGLRVVPVGFKGVDLTRLPPPLSLLQGFNITSKDGFDNLIALANDSFKHSHESRFTQQEYQEVVSIGEPMAKATLGAPGQFIDEIRLALVMQRDLVGNLPLLFTGIHDILRERGIRSQREQDIIHLDGVSIHANTAALPGFLEFTIDPSLFHLSAPLLKDLIQSARKDGVQGIVFHFLFRDEIATERGQHRLSSRLYGTAAQLDETSGFVYHELRFSIEAWWRSALGAACPVLAVTINSNVIPLDRIRSLLELLFETRVLFVADLDQDRTHFLQMAGQSYLFSQSGGVDH